MRVDTHLSQIKINKIEQELANKGKLGAVSGFKVKFCSKMKILSLRQKLVTLLKNMDAEATKQKKKTLFPDTDVTDKTNAMYLVNN